MPNEGKRAPGGRGKMCAMPRAPKIHQADTAAFAALCIAWLVEEAREEEVELCAKLAVPPSELMRVLTALTPPERAELQRMIARHAAVGPLPGPLSAEELGAFLDWTAKAGPRTRAKPADDRPCVSPSAR